MIATTLWTNCCCGEDTGDQQFDLNDPCPAIEAIRKAHSLPGLGAAIVTDEGIQLLSTTGVRKKGDNTLVTDNDLWHIGSCGKAITATMIARLVEDGKLSFDQTLGETFPEFDSKMSDQLKSAQLIHLLSHTSWLAGQLQFAGLCQRTPGDARTAKGFIGGVRDEIAQQAW